jgi:hypothetical protein
VHLQTGVRTILGAACCLAPNMANAAPCNPPDLKCPPDRTCGGYGECVPVAPTVDGPFVHRRTLALDTTYFSRPNAGHRQTIDAIVIKGAFPYRNATFEPEVPLVYDASLDAQTALLAGNPSFTVKGHWLEGRTDFYAGGGAALPVASFQDDIGHFAPFILATAAQGFWNNWWYATDVVPLFAPFGVRHVTRGGFDISADGALALLFPTPNGVDHYPLVLAQGGVTVGYVSPVFETGIRFRAVNLPNNDAPDSFQSSIEPFARYIYDNVFVGAGFLANLGEYPIGVLVRDPNGGLQWNRNGVWGLRLEGGVKF